MHNVYILYVLSVLPILSLIFISLKKGVGTASLVSFVLTLGLYFFWQNPLNYLFATLVTSLLPTLTIVMIVFGAIFLFSVMQNAGLISKICHSLDGFHPSKEIRFFLLAISLTVLFEGVAGFGTPGVLVPFLLISLGYDTVMSISIVLLLDAIAVTFGAVGAPIFVGLKAPLGLSSLQSSTISFTAGCLGAFVGLLILWFIFKIYEQYQGKMQFKKEVTIIYLFFAIPFVTIAKFFPDLPSVLSPIIMLGLSYLYLHHTESKLNLKPWIPYTILTLLLLIPKLVPSLAKLLSYPIRYSNLFNTGITASIKPFQSPLFPFLIVGIGLSLFYKTKESSWKPAFKKTLSSVLVLFPVVAISQLMINSGAVYPSMVSLIARMFALVGSSIYIFVAPFIGITGGFVSGSNTMSNIIFGPTQLEAAKILYINQDLVLSLQTSGGALGNAICLFNIITASSVVGFKEYQLVLKKNLFPILMAGIVMGTLGILGLYFYGRF